jgi:hypothetical protein
MTISDDVVFTLIGILAVLCIGWAIAEVFYAILRRR